MILVMIQVQGNIQFINELSVVSERQQDTKSVSQVFLKLAFLSTTWTFLPPPTAHVYKH